MEKQKKWQFFFILVVIALTVYNILPTVFYYTKPLNRPIEKNQAEEIALSIENRVNALEEEATDWLHSYSKLLKVKPLSISVEKDNPQRIAVLFQKEEDAKKFRNHLPQAGALIPFAPAQLGLGRMNEENPKKVWIERRIPIQFPEKSSDSFFAFTAKTEKNGEIAPLYKEIIVDRAAGLASAVGGMSESSLLLAAIVENPSAYASQELTYNLAVNIASYVNVFGENSSIVKRYFASFAQDPIAQPSQAIRTLSSSFDKLKDEWKMKRIELGNESEKTEDLKSKIRLLERKEDVLAKASAVLKKHAASFERKEASLKTPEAYNKLFAEAPSQASSSQTLQVGKSNPFIKDLTIDWASDKIILTFHQDFRNFRKDLEEKENKTFEKDELEQLLINEVARLSRLSGEKLSLLGNELSIPLDSLLNSKSMLVLKLPEVAQKQAEGISASLRNSWNPKHPELSAENFPIVDEESYLALSEEQKSLCLLVYAPVASKKEVSFAYRPNSLYVIAKGVDNILKKYQTHPDSEEARVFLQDFYRLQDLLRQNGFQGYSGDLLPKSLGLSSDYIFERGDYYQTILAATRENFHVAGSKKFAVLEFTDLEQRILTQNKIDTRVHEDLLKARDDYHAAQVSLNPAQKYDAPKPSKNILWNNFILSAKKYFRGDERKILHWGLDLSGGKTVSIELRDQQNRPVKDEADLKQGMNELYNRVNKMGVSEVTIRLEGSNIMLDFPGSQNLSAAELVKASSMYFHIVNEKFSSFNASLEGHTNRFLQEVWNEAVVTNRKDIESLQLIAWKHLYGDTLDPEVAEPRSEAAKVLYENGLRLASPFDEAPSALFNDSLSKLALFRGEEWSGQAHPLLIVFRNFALEGSNLDNIRAAYDPSKGNYLSFDVKGSYTDNQGRKVSPREELHAWTSQFSKEKITGTSNETFSRGKGWRMAVILNDSVISAPTLESALKDSALISGNFSQREANQLAADLKAGSLTFTPRILSEMNVSPELGIKDRTQGILATVVALILVVAAMIGYYRFAGIVASVAVLFNLLIMWATLQNLGATLTLAGIAGIILTLGMAVDANVLVFERIREEYAVSKRIASAVHAGYKKAFSAILDSNVTTIIAALILLNFDSGPIKAFAVNLIIGIVSSMFTALFMTRYFFAGWVKNPEHQSLSMASFVKASNFDFLKKAKPAFLLTAFLIIAGGAAFVSQKSGIFGMDFTGGYALTLEVEPRTEKHYRESVEKALLASGASSQDFQVRELSPDNHLRIMLGTSMEKEGKPFYNMPLETDSVSTQYLYQTNPRISWVVDALQKQGFTIEPRVLSHLEANWTAMSGQLSDSMRNNAMAGLLIALIAIFIYITFRFEFKFAISAILCTLHDVVITISAIAILHYLRVPVLIDMNTIAAIMTIIGYSLNDTIIIFDRIREDSKMTKRSDFRDIVNHALNVTLSRTTITSGTTLLVLLALVALGGSTIFSFALVMSIGVVFGTLSSLFVASPLMLFFHNKEEKKDKAIVLKEEPS